jgi:hypothetical protein
LARRWGDQETVCRTITAWETQRKAEQAPANGRFTTAKARRKRRHIYPL